MDKVIDRNRDLKWLKIYENLAAHSGSADLIVQWIHNGAVNHTQGSKKEHEWWRSEIWWSDMVVGSQASSSSVFDVQFDIDVFTRHARYTKRKLRHACGISNKNERISMRPYRRSVLKCWTLHGEKRFDRIQIWLQNAGRDIFGTWLV